MVASESIFTVDKNNLSYTMKKTTKNVKKKYPKDIENQNN